MNNTVKCDDCKGYQSQGHNYCRMCGFSFSRGMVPNARLAVAYFTNEKFCGYCGSERGKCKC